jgi:hypothetical protein
MRRYHKSDWEIKMLLDKYPNGCTLDCFCDNPAEDCGCPDCQKRHAYKLYYSIMMHVLVAYRLN